MRGFLRRVDFVTKPRSSILNFSSFVNVVRSNSIYQIPITPSSSIRQFHATELLLAKPKKDKKPKIIDDDDDLDDDDSPGTSKPSIDKNTLPEIPKFETQMDARIDKFISELEKLRSGNPSSDILSHITVNMTGSKIKITDLGQVSMRNQSQLSVSVFDPANVESVATAIREDKSLNLNPSVEGNLLLVTVPKPSREHRETLAKAAAKLADKSKTEIRNVRKDGMDAVKKLKGTVSEDDSRQFTKKLDLLTEKKLERINKLLKDKESKLLED